MKLDRALNIGNGKVTVRADEVAEACAVLAAEYRKLLVEQPLATRAFDLADDCMRSQLECEGVPLGDLKSGRYAPVSFELSRRVPKIEEANEFFREAWEWLRDRGLAHLEKDGVGDVVVIELEKFD